MCNRCQFRYRREIGPEIGCFKQGRACHDGLELLNELWNVDPAKIDLNSLTVVEEEEALAPPYVPELEEDSDEEDNNEVVVRVDTNTRGDEGETTRTTKSTTTTTTTLMKSSVSWKTTCQLCPGSRLGAYLTRLEAYFATLRSQ